MAWTPGTRAFIQRAEAYRARGQTKEAVETCLRGLENRPDFLFGRFVLSKCYLEAGRIEEAEGELKRVIAGVEECFPAYTLLGETYLREGAPDKAMEVLRRALVFFPGDEKIKQKMAAVEMDLISREVPSPPGGVSREGHQTTPEEKPVRTAIQTDTLAEICIKQGHLSKAIAIYQEILVKDPKNQVVREKLAGLRKQVKDKQRIIAHKKVINILGQWLAAVSSAGTSPPS